jgi:ribose 1,5-bisphosphokinase
MVVVVGPSGAGKDSLLQLARQHFEGRSDVHFVRRAITRPADAGGEDHMSVSDLQFDNMVMKGAFAVHWTAHGLSYGIPAEVRLQLSRGDLVIANGSRSVLPAFVKAFPHLQVINITARPEVLAERLQARGRESQTEIVARLKRSEEVRLATDAPCRTIDNSGQLIEAGEQLVELLELLAARRTALAE